MSDTGLISREYIESVADTLRRNAPLVIGVLVQQDMATAAELLTRQYDEIERLKADIKRLRCDLAGREQVVAGRERAAAEEAGG